jgi:osmotically inducible lipoprotein OsmB
MKHMRQYVAGSCIAALLLGMGGCSGMTKQQRDTAIGAGVGGVAGSVLTNGSAVGTVGGAAIGGVIGHEVGKNGK